MSLVLGVAFGTLSVRASVFDHEQGRLSSGTAQDRLKLWFRLIP
jgi:ribulose kinase